MNIEIKKKKRSVRRGGSGSEKKGMEGLLVIIKLLYEDKIIFYNSILMTLNSN